VLFKIQLVNVFASYQLEEFENSMTKEEAEKIRDQVNTYLASIGLINEKDVEKRKENMKNFEKKMKEDEKKEEEGLEKVEVVEPLALEKVEVIDFIPEAILNEMMAEDLQEMEIKIKEKEMEEEKEKAESTTTGVEPFDFW
jgi:Asp-tRNA(Asn)/Glu-tRNA(Gln) amidotransferase C subunit